MLKQTVTYEDFNGVTRTDDLYFNISKTELADRLDLVPKLEKLRDMLSGGERVLEMDEIKQILDLVKDWAKMSYGIRSEDGLRFRKNEQIWEEFTETAAYDAFMISLFEQPERAMQFLIGVIPKDLAAKAQEDVQGQTGVKFEMPVQEVADAPKAVDFLNMTPEEFAAYKAEQNQA